MVSFCLCAFANIILSGMALVLHLHLKWFELLNGSSSLISLSWWPYMQPVSSQILLLRVCVLLCLLLSPATFPSTWLALYTNRNSRLARLEPRLHQAPPHRPALSSLLSIILPQLLVKELVTSRFQIDVTIPACFYPNVCAKMPTLTTNIHKPNKTKQKINSCHWIFYIYT